MVKEENKQSDDLKPILDAYRLASKRLLLLDYDGTLAPYAPRPEQAKPTGQTLAVIKKLANDSRNTVIIISGRQRDVLDEWLGHLPVQLIAEHGAFEKYDGTWQTIISLGQNWKEKIRSVMQPYINKTLGTLLEEKDTALVFHYRDATDPKKAKITADTLFDKLKPIANKLGLHISHASMTIEVREEGADKGQAALNSLALDNYDFVLCAGDSQTDEDMFTKLSQKAFCIKVGPEKTAATHRVKSPEALLNFLEVCA